MSQGTSYGYLIDSLKLCSKTGDTKKRHPRDRRLSILQIHAVPWNCTIPGPSIPSSRRPCRAHYMCPCYPNVFCYNQSIIQPSHLFSALRWALSKHVIDQDRGCAWLHDPPCSARQVPDTHLSTGETEPHSYLSSVTLP